MLWSALVQLLVMASGDSLVHDVCSLVQGLKEGSCRRVFVFLAENLSKSLSGDLLGQFCCCFLSFGTCFFSVV